MKTEIYSGKTLRPANLSNEHNMLFLIFRFPKMCGKQVKKNKMDNSQNDYSSVGTTGKIKKMSLIQPKKFRTWETGLFKMPCLE